jgi:ATP-dependent helicase YprA (DUF1998 family)
MQNFFRTPKQPKKKTIKKKMKKKGLGPQKRRGKKQQNKPKKGEQTKRSFFSLSFAQMEVDQETTFDSFGLDDRLRKGIYKLGFQHPTLIQSAAIPLALKGKDILARARTGSGKTGAYGIPIVQSIIPLKEKKALQNFFFFYYFLSFSQRVSSINQHKKKHKLNRFQE